MRTISLIVLFGVFAIISAIPTNFESAEIEEIESTAQPPSSDDVLVRNKRATCDLLSGLNVGNSACAAHCILLGKKGGWCDSRGVCNCRN